MWEKTVWKVFRRNAEERRSAVGDLHADYGDWLLHRLTNKYGLEIAEDVVQETWLHVGPLTAKSYIAHPKALLLTIASNLARNMGVKQAVRRRHDAHIVMGSHEEPSQLTQVLAQQLLLGLPAPLRDVFVLSRIVGLTNVQIAERLGISPKTVEGRMTKAVAHCAAQLRR